MKHKQICLFLIVPLFFIQCGDIREKVSKMQEQANQEFGDQNFKTAISLIELHKIRFGSYPESLDSLKYIGDWDKNSLTSIKYTKVDSGYNLDLIRGFSGKPKELKYPQDFWTGLGLKESNMKK